MFLVIELGRGGGGLLDEFGSGGTCKLLGGVDLINGSRLLKVYPNLLELSNATYIGSKLKHLDCNATSSHSSLFVALKASNIKVSLWLLEVLGWSLEMTS